MEKCEEFVGDGFVDDGGLRSHANLTGVEPGAEEDGVGGTRMSKGDQWQAQREVC